MGSINQRIDISYVNLSIASNVSLQFILSYNTTMIVTTNCKFMAIYTSYFVHKMSICEKSLYIHLMIFNDMISYLFQWLKMINKTGVSKSLVCGLVVWVWSDICYPGDWVNQDYDIFILHCYFISFIINCTIRNGNRNFGFANNPPFM